LPPKGSNHTCSNNQIQRRLEVKVADKLRQHIHTDRRTRRAFRGTRCKVMDAIKDIIQLHTTLSLQIVCEMPHFKSSQAALRGTTGMFTKARGHKGTQNKLVHREVEVFWYTFCITETNELFDST
jgi:hypothetical protein